MDGAVRRLPAADWTGRVLGRGDSPVPPVRADGGGTGAGLRRPVLPAGVAARPCADRVSVEPGRGQLEGRLGRVAVRRRGRRLWPQPGDGGGGLGLRTAGRSGAAQGPHRRGCSRRPGAGGPDRGRNDAVVRGPPRPDRHGGADRPGRRAAGVQMDPRGLSRHRRPLCESDGASRRGGAGRDHLAGGGPAGLGQSGVRPRLARRRRHRAGGASGPDPDPRPRPGRGRSRRAGGGPLLQQPAGPVRRGRRGSQDHRRL